MLTSNMKLRQMIDFEPNDEDMALLPLDVVVYLKLSIISSSKAANYEFIRYLFTSEDVIYSFKNIGKTIFYDFDGTENRNARFVTITELYSLVNYANISDLIKEILENYHHECDVLFDFFTHDSKKYRLSNLDGIVKLELMDNAD